MMVYRWKGERLAHEGALALDDVNQQLLDERGGDAGRRIGTLYQ